MNPLVFLPGASGSRQFWQPLIAHMQLELAAYQIMAYPGFDAVPEQDKIKNLDDLQHYLSSSIENKSILIAQSMGGVLAVATALKQPEKVAALVLIATSGGLDLTVFNCADWREDYQQHFQHVPNWFLHDQTRFKPEQLAALNFPILLLWGDSDPLSHVSVGQYLANILPNAEFHIIQHADHFFASTHAQDVAPILQVFINHLEKT